MSPSSPSVYLSAIDEERFGIRTARAMSVTADTIPQALDFCRANAVVLLIARCRASDLPAAQAMERAGFTLTDTLIYYERDLLGAPIPPAAGKVAVRPYRPGEENAVRQAAVAAFQGYFGHYHADPRLDRAKCDEAYASWALRSCVLPGVADAVFVADSNDAMAGFLTLRLNNGSQGEGRLLAVVPQAQGQGVARSLMIRGMEWCLANERTHMVISTQITNIAVQQVWTRLGFEPSHAYYTFHGWFDRQ